MVNEGFVVLNRKILDWGWYQNADTFRLFIHLLLTANFKDGVFEGENILRGQIATSYDKISASTGMSVQNIRTAIKHLKQTGEVDVVRKSKYQIITVVNYEKYQSKVAENLTVNQQATNNQLTINQQSTNRQLTTIEQSNNENNVNKGIKERKHAYGEYSNVLLTDEEYEKLKTEFPDYQQRIEWLSSYIASTGKVYKNHLATIRNWARRDKTDKPAEAASFDMQAFNERANALPTYRKDE